VASLHQMLGIGAPMMPRPMNAIVLMIG
jgi:hypothetical protein